MKLRITAALLAVAATLSFGQAVPTTVASPVSPDVAAAASSKTLAPCPTEAVTSPDPYKVTDTEKLAIMKSQATIQQAYAKKQSAPENAAVAKAQAEVEKTKEYKEFLKIQEKLKVTPQVKAWNDASAALQKANLDEPLNRSFESQAKLTDEMFSKRHLPKTEWVMCIGPAVANARGESLGETCKGVADDDYEFRKIQTAK